MKYCTKCGNQLQDDAAFCTNCGASTSPDAEGKHAKVAPAEEKARNEEKTEAKKTEDKPKDKGKSDLSNSLILGIAAFASFFIGYGTLSPILSAIGIIFGVKEVKETGYKTGLIVSICSGVFIALPTLIAIIGSIFALVSTVIGIIAAGGSLLTLFPSILESIMEVFEILG